MFPVVVFEVSAEADVGELRAVHAGQAPEGGEAGTLEDDVDGTGGFLIRNGQAEAVRSGVDDPVVFQGVADEGGVGTGGDLLQVLVGQGGAVVGHWRRGGMVLEGEADWPRRATRRSFRALPALVEDALLEEMVPGDHWRKFPERS